MKIERAISVLRKEYERAQALDFVRDPVAYALYQTWKNADIDGHQKEEPHGSD